MCFIRLRLHICNQLQLGQKPLNTILSEQKAPGERNAAFSSCLKGHLMFGGKKRKGDYWAVKFPHN